MHPVLFEVGGITVYSYGVLIAIGAIAGVAYMAIQGKKEMGLSFDQANNLFLLIFIAAFIGGKAFLFFEEPSFYQQHPQRLLTGRGFVFYGSFLFAVPTMLWFFGRNKLNPHRMLDIMAITTCMVHLFGRVGCFMAGCCYGKPTQASFGVIFSSPECYAEPKNTPLHPTQLYEASFIFAVMLFLFFLRERRVFYGQLFLVYLIAYATGRIVLEFFRGDEIRGFVIEGVISHSQLIAFVIILISVFFYWRWWKQNPVMQIKKRA